MMENKYEQELIKNTVKMSISRGVVYKYNQSSFNIYFLSDLHCGSMDCNYELLQGTIKLIQKDKKALVILGGDTIEGIPRGYKINEEGQHCPIDMQIARTIKYLKPIAKKIVVMFSGNHNTKARGESVDSDFMIATALNVPYKTVPTLIQIHTPQGTIKLAGGHGKGFSANQDTELDKVRKVFPYANAYFLGHTHALYVKQVESLKYDENGVEEWDPVYYMRTGNFVNYAEYARYSVLPPQRSGCVKLIIKKGRIVSGDVLTDTNILGRVHK